MSEEKKLVTVISIALVAIVMTACSATYTVKFGKKCTPDHKEWSYVWFVEKEGNNVAKENCKKGK